MKKFFLALLVALSSNLHAQTPDRYRVLDYFQNQQFDEAISYLQNDLDSSNVQSLIYLGYAFAMNEEPVAAKQCYAAILSVDSNNIAANQYLSRHYSYQDPETAKIFTTRLVRLQPLKSAHLRVMGELCLRTEKKDSALLYFDSAYRIDGDDKRNIAALAQALADKKIYDRADSVLQTGLIRDSTYSPFLVIAIRINYEQKRYDDVLPLGERMMKNSDGGVFSLAAYSQFILSYYHLEKHEESISVCQFLRAQQVDAEVIYYYEAKAWAKLKNYNKSNELLRTCLSKAVSKNTEAYYHALAENFESMKKFRTAVRHYDTAFYIFHDPIMKYNSGRIYDSELNDPKTALGYYKKYLSLANPDTEDEQKIYEYVSRKVSKQTPRR